MQTQHGFYSDVGLKRDKNQDHYACAPEDGLFLVADGMGGHQGGETASQLAAEVIPAHVKAELASLPSLQLAGTDLSLATREKIGQILKNAIELANAKIYEMSKNDGALQGMGTTTTALLLLGQYAWIGHVGDSRCYFIRPDENAIWQVTRDHSWVQEKIRAGLITRAQAKTDRMRNVITRSVGFEPHVDVDIYTAEVQTGDAFLLCSDGLTGHLDDMQLLQALKKNLGPKADTVGMTAKKLIDEANARGGDDNITAVIVRIPD
jgi:serine/threonine protein phosphatase PrpC